MHFERALRLIHTLRRDGDAARAGGGPFRGPPEHGRAGGNGTVHAASICIASGKGGTGKSVVTASLAALLSTRGRTLIVDADMGVGNAHLLHDIAPQLSFVDVVAGRCEVEGALSSCGAGVELLSAGSGVSRMAGLSPYELHLIASGLERLDSRFAYTLVDSAAGISEQTIAFAAACDLVLVVTTPDVTAMTDAYAFLKVLFGRRPSALPLLLVNRVLHDHDGPGATRAAGEHVAERIAQVCMKFLGREPRLLGVLPEDPAVTRSIGSRRPLVICERGAPAALALQALCVPLVDLLDRLPHPGLGSSLTRAVGYASATA